jgi:4-amino-4-deoxy-L-arabinose transferase-like glycosyltransferase
VGGLFGLALVIRLVYALQLTFPPLDDPAYYVQGARSFFTDHPLAINIIWNYHPAPAKVLHPGFDFWMPLTSFLIALSFLFFGDNTLAAQLPGVIAGASLPVLTFWLARQAFAGLELKPRYRFYLSGAAGLYIALNPLLAYQSAVPDSQMIFAALVTGAILVWSGRESPARNFGLGLLMGLAYLTRSHAVFLVMAFAIVTLVKLLREREDRGRTFKLACFSAGGLGLVVGPWLLRNWLTFGALSSPAAVESALIYDYATLFNYETPINFSSFASLGLDKIFQVRLAALYNTWVEVLGVMFLPSFILPGAGLFLLWRRSPALIGRWLLYGLLSGLALPLLFATASINGSFYHSAGSLAAFGAIGFVFLLYLAGEYYRKLKPHGAALFPLLFTALLAVELVQFGVSVGGTIATHRHDQAVYARLGSWLAANAPAGPIIVDEPSTLNYATGRPALRLPADDPLEVVQRLADRYKAGYIVVTSNFGRYPALLQASGNQTFPLAYRDPQAEFEIYKVPGNP